MDGDRGRDRLHHRYQANVGCIGTILGPGDTVICDSGDHASILDGCKLSGARLRPFRHNQMDKLERMLERAAGDGGGVMVIVDGVFSMEGDLCDLPPIVELCERYGARLMVDEAHAVGVLGARGAGTCELFGLEDRVDLRMGTFSKSLASCGGFIAGSAEVIEYLRIASRPFIFTASAVPAAVGAALGALRVIRSEGPELIGAAARQRALPAPGVPRPRPARWSSPGTLPDGGEATTPVVPVVVGEDWQAVLLWKALFDAGVYTNVAIHPAVPPGGALLRTSLMATHERRAPRPRPGDHRDDDRRLSRAASLRVSRAAATPLFASPRGGRFVLSGFEQAAAVQEKIALSERSGRAP